MQPLYTLTIQSQHLMRDQYKQSSHTILLPLYTGARVRIT